MTTTRKSPAVRNYHHRFFISMGLYVVLLFSVAWIFPHLHPSGSAAYMLAILPALPLIGVIVVLALYLAEEKDEFQRSLMVLQMLSGIGATLAVTTVWGFLENFTNTPHLQPYLVFPMFCFFMGAAGPVFKWRYR